MVGLLGRVTSPSQGRTTQHRKTWTNIHALSGIRTHDPSNQPANTHASDRTATVTGMEHYNMKFEVFTAVKVQIVVICIVAMCILVGGNRRFRGIYCRHRLGIN
jgi:hypothetical protein